MHEILLIPQRSDLNRLSGILEQWYFQIKINGESIDVCQNQKLGQGSTKNVFDVCINNKRFALALPNTNDDSETIRTKWGKALHEPINTERLRKLGFLVNPVCQVVPVEIDSVSFPVILMKRYEDLGFGILDGRNSISGTVKERILPKPLTEDSLIKFLEKAFPDIQKLIKHKIELESDSFNTALVEGHPRLYLNDLGKPRYSFNSSWTDDEEAKRYVKYFIASFINGLWWKEHEENEDFFESLFFGETNTRFMNRILKNFIL